MKKLFTLLLVFTATSYTFAGVFDATDELEGKVVIYAGNVESLDCPIGGKYDCLTWPTNLLKFKYKDVCFTSDIGACGSIGCKGFIAVGKDKIPYFFTVENIGDDIKKHSVTYYRCPDMY